MLEGNKPSNDRKREREPCCPLGRRTKLRERSSFDCVRHFTNMLRCRMNMGTVAERDKRYGKNSRVQEKKGQGDRQKILTKAGDLRGGTSLQ